MRDEDKGVYSPPSDEYERFDVAGEDDSRRGPLLLVVAVAVLFAFAAVIYTAYHQGVRSGGREQAPLIAGGSEPVKTKPKDEPKAKQPENSAYDQLDQPGQSQQVTTAPPPEQPIKAAEQAEPQTQMQIQPQTQPKTTPAPTPRPQPAPVTTQKSSAPALVDPNGRYLVQLGAFREQAQASAFWKRLQDRLPVVMDGARMDVQKADLGAKGIYYRLRAAAFADRPTAMAFCQKLKSNGQDCIVVAK